MLRRQKLYANGKEVEQALAGSLGNMYYIPLV